MAVAFTSLAAVSTSTSNTSSYAGTAGTPANGDLLICGVLVSDSTVAGGAWTMSGAWTWTRFFDFTFNGGLDTIALFWARATAATSTTPTVDVTGDNGTGACLHCWRVTGADGAGTPYCRQIKTNTGSSANPSVTMDAAILTGNGVFSFAGNGTNSTTQWTNPSGWASDLENAFTSPTHGFASASRGSGETGSTITWTNANTTAWGVVVVEVYVSGTGITPIDCPGMFGVGAI